MNPNQWRIEGVRMREGKWGYALFEPGYVQVPIATSDSWEHLWTLIRLCGFLDVYAERGGVIFIYAQTAREAEYYQRLKIDEGKDAEDWSHARIVHPGNIVQSIRGRRDLTVYCLDILTYEVIHYFESHNCTIEYDSLDRMLGVEQ